MTSSGLLNIAALSRACLEGRPFAWQSLVDTCAPIVMELIRDYGRLTHSEWSEPQISDLATQVFHALHANHYQALRDIDPDTNGQIFLAVVVRRVAQSMARTSAGTS